MSCTQRIHRPTAVAHAPVDGTCRGERERDEAETRAHDTAATTDVAIETTATTDVAIETTATDTAATTTDASLSPIETASPSVETANPDEGASAMKRVTVGRRAVSERRQTHHQAITADLMERTKKVTSLSGTVIEHLSSRIDVGSYLGIEVLILRENGYVNASRICRLGTTSAVGVCSGGNDKQVTRWLVLKEWRACSRTRGFLATAR
jgi:hypothetical protein